MFTPLLLMTVVGVGPRLVAKVALALSRRRSALPELQRHGGAERRVRRRRTGRPPRQLVDDQSAGEVAVHLLVRHLLGRGVAKRVTGGRHCTMMGERGWGVGDLGGTWGSQDPRGDQDQRGRNRNRCASAWLPTREYRGRRGESGRGRMGPDETKNMVSPRLTLDPLLSSPHAARMEDPVGDLCARVGEPMILATVAAFYRRIADDDLLRPLYPETDLAPAERRLADFLVGRFGGENRYVAQRGHPRLRMRHAPFAIDIAARDRWMQRMAESMTEVAFPEPERTRAEAFLAGVATFLIGPATA